MSAKKNSAAQIRNKPCAVILIGVSSGVLFDRLVAWSFGLSWMLALVFALTHILCWRRGRCNSAKGTKVLSVLLFLGWVCGGACWHHFHYRIFRVEELGRLTREEAVPVALRAVVTSKPMLVPSPESTPMDLPLTEETRTKMVIEVAQLRDGMRWIRVTGKAMVTIAAPVSDVSVGDEVELWGRLSAPSGKRSRGDFSLREFLRSQRIHSLVFVSCSQNIRTTGHFSSRFAVSRVLACLEEYCSDSVDRHFSPESAKLVRAMLLGERHKVTQKTQDQFLVTGTMHLLAISGLHIGILASLWLMLIRLGLLPRRTGYWLTIGFTCVYCLMIGARPPVFRATVLVVLYCLAKVSGRNPVSVNSLCLAGLSVILVNPVALFQPGSQLSFVAVAVLIMIGDQVQREKERRDSLTLFLLRKRNLFERQRDQIVFYFRMLAISSLGIWIATLPLVAEVFHVISPIGILVNILLMLPVALLLNFCFLAMALGFIGLGGPFSWCSERMLDLITSMIQLASGIPFGHWWTFGMGTVWLSIFYACFTLFFLDSRFRLKLHWQLTLALVWLATALVATGNHTTQRAGLNVTFVDVGHGVCVLIEYPNGKNVLYDAGCLNSSKIGYQRISAILWERRIVALDAIIVSHADLDHYNSIPQLIERFFVSHLVLPSDTFCSSANESLRFLDESVIKQGIPQTAVNSGWTIQFDQECPTSVLHPAPEFRGQSDNANSLVIQINYKGRTVLLTGDLELDGLEALLNQNARAVDLMLVPHHGSARVDHDRLAEWANPFCVVISAGKKGPENEVREIYQRRGADVYTTTRSGSIRFELNRDEVKIERFIDN